jgi:type III secretion protein R
MPSASAPLLALALIKAPQAHPAAAASGPSLASPVVMVIVLGALSLAPFVLIMLTSFVKISVVLSILRNALGTQSAPPNQVITGLAFVLSIFIMTPVAKQMYHDAGTIADTREMFSEASVKSLFDGIERGKEPLRQFLAKHAHPQDQALFVELAERLDQKTQASSSAEKDPPATGGTPVAASVAGAVQPLTVPASESNGPASSSAPNGGPTAADTNNRVAKDGFQVLIPAFVTSQLKEAFQAGFLIFVPFIIIDMVIANVLLAMGMSMLSPSVISLPFKLLLFVLVDGWFLIVRSLVLSYV